MYFHDKLETLITRVDLEDRVRKLGQEIKEAYREDEPLVVVGVMNGSFVFLADLIRAVERSLSIDFVRLSSYGDATQSSGNVRLIQDLEKSIEDKHVLVVEDIIDTGLTMQFLLPNLKSRNPRSVKLAVLLEKPAKNQSGVAADFLGFEIPDKFVVGYGLDFGGLYRNLPYIGILVG